MKYFSLIMVVLFEIFIAKMVASSENLPTVHRCTYRYNFHAVYPEWFKAQYTCEELRKMHPSCREKITVAFSNDPPYVNGLNASHVNGFIAGKLFTGLSLLSRRRWKRFHN